MTTESNRGETEMPIYVITRDGRPPSKGGVRIGYAYCAWPLGYFPDANVANYERALAVQAKSRQIALRKMDMPMEEYLRLPKAVHHDGECCSCGHFPNGETTLRGRRIIVCSKPSCKEMMRPMDS